MTLRLYNAAQTRSKSAGKSSRNALKQLCVTQAGDGPSGGASLCRDLILLWLIAAFFIDKVEEMRGGARVA